MSELKSDIFQESLPIVKGQKEYTCSNKAQTVADLRN